MNRNQIGAVVGVQPFGGEGLSGTGPKAGGPNYLKASPWSGCARPISLPLAAMRACSPLAPTSRKADPAPLPQGTLGSIYSAEHRLGAEFA